MSPNRALSSVDLISRGVPWRGDDAPRPRQASPNSPRLHAIIAGLAMRVDKRQEMIDPSAL